MTQQKAVETWLDENGSITSFDAFVDLGIMQLPYVIKMLELKGLELDHVNLKRKTRYGKMVRIVKYTKRGLS